MNKAANEILVTEIDRCVMCGMCSQFCPTYQITQNENESPRGRIALINAVNIGHLSISKNLVDHLDHCTYCRACEDYCPSGVRFELIMDEAKAMIADQHTLPREETRLLSILSSPNKTRRLGRWLERYQRWGLQRLMRASGLLSLTGFKKEDNLLPRISDAPALPDYSPAVTTHRGNVALFTGCISSILDRNLLDASRQLLNLLGYGVYTPAGQTCCGALHQHSGDSNSAAELASNNLAVFSSLNVEAIVHTSSGCTSFLKEYDQLLNRHGHQTNASSFCHKVQDINQFLSGVPWPDSVEFSPLTKRIAVHEPCSARNVLHQADKTYRLLENIPGLELIPLPGNDQCCGASGSQMLSPTRFTERLRQNKLDALSNLINMEDTADRTRPNDTIDTLVTTNIGCALHLAAGLREKGINVEIIHPVILLLNQIEIREACTPTQTSVKVMA